MTARPHANLPQFFPKRQWRRYGTNSPVSWNKWDLARGTRRWLGCLAPLEPGFRRYAYPLPAYCLLIACSEVVVTIRILNEMRLDYSPLHAGFAYKTTEQLWHWRVLLRCIVCSQDDAVLVHPELVVPVRCCGSWAKLCARKLHKLGAARRAGCAHSSGSVWAMNVPGYRSSGAALCCGLIHQYRGAHVSQIVVPWSLVVAEPCAWAGARRVARCTARLRFELRGRSAPSCAHCCVRMRIRWTRLPIPVATRLRI